MVAIRLAAMTCLGVLITSPVLAEGLDGRWDCSERAKPVGSFEISGEAYTFTKTDGTAGEPGTIDYQGSDQAFAVVSGGLQTELTAIGAFFAEDVLYVAVEHGGPVECTIGKPG